MYRVTIVYNQPADPAAFDEHYSSKHLPLVQQIPSVKRFAAGKCESLDGNPPRRTRSRSCTSRARKKPGRHSPPQRVRTPPPTSRTSPPAE